MIPTREESEEVCGIFCGLKTAIGNHSFHAIGITDYLENGGEINIAKRMAVHANIKTTELYDWRVIEGSFSEIKRVGIKTSSV